MEFELRPWRDSDAADLFRYGCTPDIIRYMAPGYPRTREDCARVAGSFAREDGRKQRCRAVAIRGAAVGSVGAFLRADGTAWVAYWLGTEFQRQGVMTAVLRQFCAQLWADYELTALTARPHEDNMPSRRTLERAGFRRMPDGIYRLERGQELRPMEKWELELAVELRHELHAHPELSNEERWTKARLMAFLKEHTHLELADRGAWFYARYHSGGAGPAIAFRADFDALPIRDVCGKPYASQFPGLGHKCGHDGHSATLAALGLALEAKRPERDVVLVFQHAEETGDGGAVCAGVADEMDIGEIYAFHNMSGAERGAVCLRDGTVNFASRGITISFTGVATHASTPELGRNPAYAAARLVTALPALTDPALYDGPVLCTVIQIDVGERAFGVSAHGGKVLLTIRAEKEAELDRLQAELEALARREALRDGLDCQIHCCDVFPETANDPGCAQRVRAAAGRLGYKVFEMPEAMRGSEDFGHYLKKIKGAIFYLGNGTDYPPLHSEAFDFPDWEIGQAVALFQELI